MKKTMFVAVMAMLLLAACGNNEPQGVGIVAHRGYWQCEEAGNARNSVAALRCAQEAGFWGSEFDVNMTQDEVLVVWHDHAAADMRFIDHPFADFADVRLDNGEPIPTLDDYLRQAQQCTTTRLVLELKSHPTPELEDRAAELCVQKLKEYDLFDPDRVIFISFSVHACQRFAALAPGFTVQYLGYDVRPKELAAMGIKGIDSNYHVLLEDSTWLPEARAEEMSVNVWTVNGEKRIREAIGFGIDQLTTDKPDLVRELLVEMGVKERK